MDLVTGLLPGLAQAAVAAADGPLSGYSLGHWVLSPGHPTPTRLVQWVSSGAPFWELGLAFFPKLN